MKRGKSAPACIAAADLLTARRWITEAIQPQARPGVAPWPDRMSTSVLVELLVYERCAAWLLDSLSSDNVANELPATVTEAIRMAAARETQSVMRARVEGRELAEIATRLGIPVVVLKGGVRAITGESPALALVDIDVLVDHANVPRVVAELERSGFGKALAPLSHHQGIDPAEGRLSVEVHWTTFRDGRPLDPQLWNRIRPLPGMPGLFALGNADHLLHVVRHALVNHRQRSVTIRDTLLAGIAARDCSAEEVDEVRRQLAGDPNEDEAVNMISFGLRLVEAQGSADDPFVEKCATFYSAVALAPRLPRALASPAALAFTTEIALGRVGVLYAAKNSLQWRGTGVDALSAASEKFPRVIRPLMGVAHLGYYSVAAAVALPMISRTRKKALSELDRRKL